jgi:hypothetical protein
MTTMTAWIRQPDPKARRTARRVASRITGNSLDTLRSLEIIITARRANPARWSHAVAVSDRLARINPPTF